jgi:hypothetical protein
MADVSLSAVSRIVLAVETRHSLRLVLMRGLSGMHHDPVMASQAAETIIEAMREYPTLDMTLEGLRAMTRLTCLSRVCVDRCFELLVSTLQQDVRRVVRLQAARCLGQLSPTDYILWAVPIGDLPPLILTHSLTCICSCCCAFAHALLFVRECIVACVCESECMCIQAR